jgi:hypothetical protein
MPAGKSGAVEVKEGRGLLPTVFLTSATGATAEVGRQGVMGITGMGSASATRLQAAWLNQ